VIYSALTLRLL